MPTGPTNNPAVPPLAVKSRGTYNPSPYKANKYYTPVEVDELFAAIPSPISPGSQLSFAEGLRKLLDLITEVKQTERRKEYVSRMDEIPVYKPKEPQQQNTQRKEQVQSSNTSSNKSTENRNSTSMLNPTNKSDTIDIEKMYPNLPVFPPDYKEKTILINRNRRIKDINYPNQKNKDTVCMETINIAITNFFFKNIELQEKMEYNAGDTVFSSTLRMVGENAVDHKLIFKFYIPGNSKRKNNKFKQE